jgi:hypothetical protein
LFEELEWLGKDNLKEILEKLVEESLLRRESLVLFGVCPKLEQLIEDKAIFSNISGSDSGIPIFHEGGFSIRKVQSVAFPQPVAMFLPGTTFAGILPFGSFGSLPVKLVIHSIEDILGGCPEFPKF